MTEPALARPLLRGYNDIDVGLGSVQRRRTHSREDQWAWVFKGTRVPVRALFENLEGGAGVNDFLQWFPGVTHEQVIAVLEHAEQSLVET